jgi:small multidrug resistance family-3 protein
MDFITTTKSIFYFLLAGLFEIGGGYLVWLWLREGKPLWYALIGGVVLVLYGVVPTLQPAHFGQFMPPMAGSLSCFRFCGDGKSTTLHRTPMTS